MSAGTPAATRKSQFLNFLEFHQLAKVTLGVWSRLWEYLQQKLVNATNLGSPPKLVGEHSSTYYYPPVGVAESTKGRWCLQSI